MIVFIISEVIFGPMFLLSLYLLMKLYKKYKLTDKPMILSICSVVLTLLSLVIYCGMSLDVYIKRSSSFWLQTNLRANIWIAEGFNIEIFILLGLIFDLYKWHLFIAMTKEYDESIKDRTPLEAKVLQNKIRVYYAFILVASLVIIAYVALLSVFLATSYSKDANVIWIKVFRDVVNSFYIIFLVAYIITLTILRHQLQKYFPHYYQMQKRKLAITSFSLIISISAKIIMRLLYLMPG